MRAFIIAVVAAVAVGAATPAAAARLSSGDRAAINRALDAFVVSAVKRRDVAASYDVVTPQLRGGLSRSQWRGGNIPVYPYEARGATFHEWTVDYVEGNEVGFELMLKPRNQRQDSITFNGAVKKIGGRWLVDSFTPVALFSSTGAPKVVGPHDFAASNSAGAGGQRRLGAIWITLPAGLLALGLLALVGFLVASWRRGRVKAPTVEERARYAEFAERLRAGSSQSS